MIAGERRNDHDAGGLRGRHHEAEEPHADSGQSQPEYALDAPGEQEFLKARPKVRLDAVENYIRGLVATTPEQRHRFFTQAAHRQPIGLRYSLK